MRKMSNKLIESEQLSVFKFDVDDVRFPLIFKNNEGDSYAV